MHFAANGPAMRAGLHICRQQPGFGFDLVQVFANGQRVPHLDAVVLKAGHQHG